MRLGVIGHNLAVLYKKNDRQSQFLLFYIKMGVIGPIITNLR